MLGYMNWTCHGEELWSHEPSNVEGTSTYVDMVVDDDGPTFNSNHRFACRSDEAQSRLVWTTTARSNFKHLLYNVRKNAQKIFQSADPTLWRERAPTWMRRDYWESLCNIWATERWQQASTTMKVNRAANPEANMHTSGSISFATHQSKLELYSQQMIEKYAGEEEQPQLDPEVWVAASSAPKKGHVYGFGHSMDMSRALSGASSSASQTSAFTTPGAPGTSPSEMMGFIRDEISSLESRLAQRMQTQVSDAIQAHAPPGPLPGQHSSAGSTIDISTGPSCE
ncbi:hypothetical protein Taro_027901 [Colocasia esculenta]|uniref:Uncharacterized protein n=1 Tax=Colocasia esculenta TaxID=4460 RepID=A0A843VVM6_COLES|nr:hypothetical protein [Colocasia esculenta]